MSLHLLPKSELEPFVRRLLTEYEVIGPMQKGSSWTFGRIEDFQQLRLHYTTTILPPKKYLLPQTETLLKFTLGVSPQTEPVLESTPRLLLGVHPCDLWAIWEMDQVFTDRIPDAHYLKKREMLTLIGWECLEPDERCFCTSVGTAVAEEGQYDLFFTDIGDAYGVQVGSLKGKRLIEDDPAFQPAQNDTLLRIQKVQETKRKQISAQLDMEVNQLPLFLDGIYDSPVWEGEAERCYSCGSCVMVCPTCFCFNVEDRVSLDLKSGARVRTWDGCMFSDFARVASGENFRESAASRVRHRIYRKFQYLMTRYGKSFCVGCGRCSRECLADIHPVGVIHQLVARHAREEA